MTRCLAGDRADELVLEAGNEGVRADQDLDVAALAALERNAVHLAVEVDGDAVMGFRLRALGLHGIGSPAVGQPLDRVRDIGVFDIRRQALEFDLREVADLEGRQHFERHLEPEIAARLERRVDRRLIGRQLDLGLAGQPKVVVVDDLLVGFGDRLLDDVGHHRLAVDLAQVFDRHLARPETLDLGFRLELGQLTVQLLGEIARRKENVVLALEPLAQRLRHLHCPIRLVL